ncbi:MAG: 5-methylcytosine-specific restriction endonuclease system specificity protein McrC [Acidobacteria bacterium]|jgi:5-methylcytosine-specific restriction enzyme subunit McrC|nr:5-methylcytosine-specific restriction endonuclease system specificity protein McrC [Acidobacteriota bacterium]
MSIPIENIYYLLCYAWNKLDEKERVAVSAEDYTKLLDLLAKVLINSTRILLKRGIDRNYIDITTEFAGVKGKLELSQTIKTQLLLKQKTVCSFDEFSSNVLTNQILVATLNRLIRTEGLDTNLKSEIKNLLWRFDEIQPIELKGTDFGKVRLHRNNKFYNFILNVCHLIYENSLLSEKTGDWHFNDFLRDERKMNQLFEAFLRNFYAIEQKNFKVRRENIYWQFSSDDKGNSRFLPLMQTDITLENETAKIIIDAKFYKETLKSNYGAEKITSANLYQLFSYLLNQRNSDPKTQTATGILIYPTIEQDYDLQFRYQNHNVLIKTVNLNSDWRSIEYRLKEIINLHFC